jgi:FkbM family methyltransferase
MLSDQVLNRRKWNSKLYDKLLDTSILKVLADHITPDTLTVDVGGNSGYQTYFHSKHNDVVTYEPVPGLFEVLQDNLKGVDNVTLINKAVGSTNTDLILHVDTKRLSMTSQIPLVESVEMVVPCVSLDNEKLANVGFIKIDVEGFELDVLEGATKTINKFRPTMMVEIYQPWCEKVGFDSKDIFDFFVQRDYTILYYDSESNKMVTCDTDEAVDAVHNLHHLHDGDFLFEAN